MTRVFTAEELEHVADVDQWERDTFAASSQSDLRALALGMDVLIAGVRQAARQARVIEQMRVCVRDPFTGCYDCAHMLDRLMAEEETR